jgi:hypothetical protein
MKIYAIYINTAQNNNNFVILKEGFSWVAALLNIFWALYHKLWLVVAIVIIFNVIIAATKIQELMLISKIVVILLFGFLSTDMREYGLRRRNYKLRDIIFADSEIEAELKYLEREYV